MMHTDKQYNIIYIQLSKDGNIIIFYQFCNMIKVTELLSDHQEKTMQNSSQYDSECEV